MDNITDYPILDLKTLYEQLTMYADYKYEIRDYLRKEFIEEFQYPNTPIHIYVHWNYTKDAITKITFSIRKENIIL